MKLVVRVQFTGNAKEYEYSVGHLKTNVRKGDRVVVPNKLKDGVLSLSIATVASDGIVNSVAEGLLPVIAVVPAEDIEHCANIVKAVEAAKVQA